VKVDYKNPDTQMTYVPSWQYNIAATYEQDVGIGRVNARVGWYGQTQVWKDVSRSAVAKNPIKLAALPSQSLISARLGLTLNNGLSFAVFGENLTNRKYYLDALDLGGRFQVGYGFTPRTHGVEVGFKY